MKEIMETYYKNWSNRFRKIEDCSNLNFFFKFAVLLNIKNLGYIDDALKLENRKCGFILLTYR